MQQISTPNYSTRLAMSSASAVSRMNIPSKSRFRPSVASKKPGWTQTRQGRPLQVWRWYPPLECGLGISTPAASRPLRQSLDRLPLTHHRARPSPRPARRSSATWPFPTSATIVSRRAVATCSDAVSRAKLARPIKLPSLKELKLSPAARLASSPLRSASRLGAGTARVRRRETLALGA